MINYNLSIPLGFFLLHNHSEFLVQLFKPRGGKLCHSFGLHDYKILSIYLPSLRDFLSYIIIPKLFKLRRGAMIIVN